MLLVEDPGLQPGELGHLDVPDHESGVFDHLQDVSQVVQPVGLDHGERGLVAGGQPVSGVVVPVASMGREQKMFRIFLYLNACIFFFLVSTACQKFAIKAGIINAN